MTRCLFEKKYQHIFHSQNVDTYTRGFGKSLNIDLYDFSQGLEKKDEGTKVNVRILGFSGTIFNVCIDAIMS